SESPLLVITSVIAASVQRAVEGFQQAGAGKWLLQQRNAAIYDFVFGDQFAGVAGHEDEPESGMGSAQAGNQFRTTHTTHDHVGQKQVDRSGVGFGYFHGGLPVTGRQDGVAVILEELAG